MALFSGQANRASDHGDQGLVIDNDANRNGRKNFFRYRCAKLYNRLPPSIRYLIHSPQFIAAIRSFDFSNDVFGSLLFDRCCRAL